MKYPIQRIGGSLAIHLGNCMPFHTDVFMGAVLGVPEGPAFADQPELASFMIKLDSRGYALDAEHPSCTATVVAAQSSKV